MTTSDTMALLGRIARQVYPSTEMPRTELDMILAYPEKGFGLLARHPFNARGARFASLLPRYLPQTCSVEDQWGFWLGWYGRAKRARSPRKVDLAG